MTIEFSLRADLCDAIKLNPEFTNEIKPFEVHIKMPPDVDNTLLVKINGTDVDQVGAILHFSNVIINYIRREYPEADRGLININNGEGFMTAPILEGNEPILHVLNVVP